MSDGNNRENSEQPRFAHPAEAEFARLLNYYGIPWEYEPRTFPLMWDEQGNVTLAFSPDFYLPEEDTYVELTTLRPSLSTIKNRKMRLMAELYPEIKIKLYKRAAVHRLLTKYGLDAEAARISGTKAQDN
jgi:hypoxanthine phosphoribosyltransferase